MILIIFQLKRHNKNIGVVTSQSLLVLLTTKRQRVYKFVIGHIFCY